MVVSTRQFSEITMAAILTNALTVTTEMYQAQYRVIESFAFVIAFMREFMNISCIDYDPLCC